MKMVAMAMEEGNMVDDVFVHDVSKIDEGKSSPKSSTCYIRFPFWEIRHRIFCTIYVLNLEIC